MCNQNSKGRTKNLQRHSYTYSVLTWIPTITKATRRFSGIALSLSIASNPLLIDTLRIETICPTPEEALVHTIDILPISLFVVFGSSPPSRGPENKLTRTAVTISYLKPWQLLPNAKDSTRCEFLDIRHLPLSLFAAIKCAAFLLGQHLVLSGSTLRSASRASKGNGPSSQVPLPLFFKIVDSRVGCC